MTFQYRFDNNWTDIWSATAQAQAFNDFVVKVAADSGVGIIGGDHFIGKSFLSKDFADRDTSINYYFKLPPQTTVPEFYNQVYGWIPKLKDQRTRLLHDLNGVPPSAMFF